MRKILMLVLLFSINLSAQEKLAEFSTNHATVAGYSMKTDILFEVYKDSLVMTFTNKRVVKQMKKTGSPTSVTYVAPYEEEKNGNLVQYVFRNDEFKASVLPNNSLGGSSVRIQTKDDFSGEVTEQLYIAI